MINTALDILHASLDREERKEEKKRRKTEDKEREEMIYPNSARPTELALEAVGKGARQGRLVRVELAHDGGEAEDGDREEDELEERLAGRGVVVLLGREAAEDVVVLVHGLAEVAPRLLVPPVAVRVAVLAVLPRRVDVAAVLFMDFEIRKDEDRYLGVWGLGGGGVPRGERTEKKGYQRDGIR